jgi:hypothetical protein
MLILSLLLGFLTAPAGGMAIGNGNHAGKSRLASEVAAPNPSPDGVQLLLRSGSFDPLQGEPPILNANLKRTLELDQPGLRLVQFPGPIQEDWYAAMQASGLEVITYLPDYAYLVWGNGRMAAKLASAVPLRWSGLYQPLYALHPALANTEKLPPEVEVIIQLYDHAGSDKTVAEILAAANRVVRPPSQVLVYQNLGVSISTDKLDWLASLPEVVNVEPRPQYERRDEIQGQIIAGNLNGAGSQPSGPGYLARLTGLGFSTDPNNYPIVDVTDDGIDNGTATPLHPDFYQFGSTSNPDRLVYNVNWTGDPLADSKAGHGNLNASIVAGYNNLTGSAYEDSNGYNYGLGINPFGRIAGSKVFNNSGSWDLPGDNYAGLLAQTYNLGGRISSNSWGADTGGQYTSDDQTYDALVRDSVSSQTGNQEMIIVFAAGNAGPGSNTVGSPGNAKNVITVGAAESYRPTWTDGCAVPPSGADNAMDIINFSSRGPTDDGRVKPEIVAPGTHIEGAASQATSYDGTGVCDQYMPAGQTLYAASSGTSHSTPAIAGAASLVYRYFQTHFGGLPPSPAMTKAYLVNATRYLTGVSANDTLPSNNQGYGEVYLGRAFDGSPHIIIDQSEVLGATGQVYETQGVITDSSKPVRVTLAWTDAPGSTVGNAYVNNLDLEVIAGGQTYKGNVFSGSSSITGGSADTRNNYESVFLPAGLSGMITVRVRATNLAGDGVPGNSDPTDQDFALDVYNARHEVGYLDGTVHDGTLGGALQAAIVQVVGGTTLFTTTSLASGYYTLTVSPDMYTVNAWKYGYTLGSASGVTVVKDLVTTQNFTLYQTAAHTLSGCVTDQATGAGLASTITVFGPFGDTITQTATTQASNCYALTLFGASYTVQAEAQLHQPGQAVVDLNSDKTQDFALLATATDGLLWGKVTNLQTGNPVDGATVAATRGGYSATTNTSGTYELQLPPGTYTVTASAPLYSSVVDRGVVIPQSNLLERNYALPTAHMVLAPPEGISVTLELGQQASRNLRVSNTGPGGLQYSAIESYGSPPSGGPDPFGYVYLDSRTAQGVAYNWIDATNGTMLSLSDDGEANVSLPFSFHFYEVTSNLLQIGNNGGVLFNATSGDVPYLNTALGTSASNYLMAPFWDDLDSDTGAVYYKTVGAAPNRQFVIEWYNRPHYDNIGSSTLELILYESSNNLKFQYQDLDFGNSSYDYGASATVGIQGSGSNYLQVSYNQAMLANNLALCFQYPGSLPCEPGDVPWLSAAPLSGSVVSSSMLNITVDFDASQVPGEGLYTAGLRFFTNDPEAQPYLDYPITMTVPPPLYALTISPEQLILTGTPTTHFIHMLLITNTGNLIDSYNLSVTNSDWVTVTPGIVTNLAVGNQVGVEVHVVIPATAVIGSTEQVVITIQSVHDAALSRQLTLWIHVEGLLRLYLPVVAK